MPKRGGAIGHLAEDVIKPLFKRADDVAEDATRLGKRKRGPGSGSDGSPTPEPKPKRPLPQWLKDKWARGEQFNKDQYHRYDHNEVTLENGKRLDSYTPGDSIVSRKMSQLSEVQEKTARSYIDEAVSKYSPGTSIKNTEHNGVVAGQTLRGELKLEIPVQDKPIPASVLRYAEDKGVQIVDITGRPYTD